MPIKLRAVWIALGLAIVMVAAIGWKTAQRGTPVQAPVGLFTTLPILWAETADLGTALSADVPQHWARGEIERFGPVTPLDVLNPAALAPLKRLVIAQPRILSPQENLALDQWVRGGGRLLLIADPALTEESAFPIGDPRRPQALAMLSPILSHWGLALNIVDEQALGEVRREVMGVQIPVNLPGHFTTQGQGNCRLWSDGLAVSCTIGKGRVIALADGAVLEADDSAGTRAHGFAFLLEAAFAGQ